MSLDTPLGDITGVGPALLAKLNTLGLKTVSDLIHYYPRRYDDYSVVTPTSKLKPGMVTIQAEVKQATGRYVRRGLHITEALASDEHGSARLVWFNQPYRAAQFKPGEQYYISGEYQLSFRRFSIMNPSVELVSDFPVNTARIVPIYRETKGLKSNQIRKLLRSVTPVIQKLPEQLPVSVVQGQTLETWSQAIMNVHFPESSEKLDSAKKRLGFQEVFELTLAALLNKQANASEHSISIPFKQNLAKEFVGKLPFKLTDDQRRATWQIYKDLEKPVPMNRLLEGDVGSGKTVVAAMAALMAMEQGYQVAFMAPTEILARQHAKTLHGLLKPLGYQDQVGLLVGSLKPAQKLAAQQAIKDHKMRLIVGTHALIAEKVDVYKLGLVIVDEQHRFGVEERKKLLKKAGHSVHVLSMTATPIPRSLALTVYGDLDISLLSEKPANRLPIETMLVPPSDRPKVNEQIRAEVKKGRQVYVVCPLVEDSELLQAKSVESVYKELSTKTFKDLSVGLLHGKLKSDEKEQIMQHFADGSIDLLVTTTVIEVGVDVPNATLMVIESPDRFGLAQIHQLRGRVGRSSHQSHCILMLDGAKQPSQRLRILSQTNDGFKLAEYDLQLRGPGALYGFAQHGALDLTFTSLTDTRAIAIARQAAQNFLDSDQDLLKYKALNQRVQSLRAVTNLN